MHTYTHTGVIEDDLRGEMLSELVVGMAKASQSSLYSYTYIHTYIQVSLKMTYVERCSASW